MWRNYVICVLVGLLLVSSGGSVVLLRQNAGLLQQLDQLKGAAAQPASTPLALAAATSVPTAEARTGLSPRAQAIAPLPTIGVVGLEALQRIQKDVASLRGLQPKSTVPVRFLDQSTLNRLYLDRFNRDYLPSERESDQKLLTTLGMIGPNDSVVQLLLDIVQEQILGVYNSDDKVMYLLASDGQFGPGEKSTVVQEFDHALQDQYYDLTTLAPKHPENDDRSLAIQALTQGDATLLQRLWAQQNLTQDELSQLGQGGAASKLLSAPLFVREQLLFPYADGFNFIRQIYQTNGYAGIDAVFQDPPRSTSQVLHINKYRAHVAPVEVSLPDLSKGALGGGWRKINSNVFGELDLRLMLAQLTDSTHGVQGASGWAGDRWQLLEKDGKQALAMKSVWDSDAAAKLFFDVYGQGLQNRFFKATVEEASANRQALTTPNAATELRRAGSMVIAVISFDRPSAEAIADAIPI